MKRCLGLLGSRKHWKGSNNPFFLRGHMNHKILGHVGGSKNKGPDFGNHYGKEYSKFGLY